ncbi:MAG: hypothetical protein ACI8X5_002706 [Planctomycetota bacterium]|jgi:hypothetical protein
MNTELKKAATFVLASCAITGAVNAQDSTSILSTFPGDALDPTSLTEQVNDYTLDVSAFRSSDGRVYGIAPLAKAGQDFFAPFFYNANISAQSISRRTKTGVPFARSSYSSWNAPGTGVHPDVTRNAPGTPVSTSTLVGNQFGYTFSQFSSDDPTGGTLSYNSVVGGVVNYENETPSRLYVTRVMGAGNSEDWFCNVSQFGMGSVDADGWIGVRADGFGSTSCGGYSTFTGNNYFLIDLLSRNAGTVNILSQLGASDTGIHVLNESATTHSPFSMIPADLAGGTPIVLGTNFNGEFVYGSASTTATTSHWSAGVSDQRGLVSYSEHNFTSILGASTTRGSAALLGKPGGTTTLMTWGLNNVGAPTGKVGFAYPGNTSISDPETGWSPAAGSTATFGNYYSSTAFRGGTGQVALGRDQAGRMLVSAQMLHPEYGSSTNPNNMLVVARTSDGSSVEWVVAAYTGDGIGKPIHGAFGSTVIGRLAAGDVGEISPSGPSISSPMMDSVGNLYFNARYLPDGNTTAIGGLFRAIYDAATFEYRLELVLSDFDVIHGANSDTDYRVNFLTFSGGSGPSPSAPFSQNINSHAYNGLDSASLDSTSTETLGGIVVRASITYDVNGDDMYEFDAGSPDQSYQTLMYITSAEDCNSNGIPDDLDISDGNSTDSDDDGVPDECGAGNAFCFGSFATCPCANGAGPAEGCENSSGVGATVFSTGTASVVNDDLGFDSAQLPTGKPCLLFSGDITVNLAFGDGIRCVGGAIKRLGVKISNGAGQASWTPSLQSVGGWGSGDTRYFQVWFRDPSGAPCGVGFNVSSALQVDFTP